MDILECSRFLMLLLYQNSHIDERQIFKNSENRKQLNVNEKNSTNVTIKYQKVDVLQMDARGHSWGVCAYYNFLH